MKTKILLAVLLIALLTGLLHFLLFYVFSGIKTPFAKACNSITIGLNEETALLLLAQYQNKNNVTFFQSDDTLTYITPGISGDYQCYIHLDRDKKVKEVTKIFD